ncbi:MAG: PIN domain-containing protein [Labilithrix sp.]|nr:PIN domain-containing protein [Labilithrix sp.]
MARTLILDSEALNALARARERPVLALRARAVLAVAHEERALVRVPAPVLAEVCRGGPRDAPIDHVLSDRGIVVAPLTASISRRAGFLLARAKLSSAHAVDAFVVATAIELGPAIVATHDRDDMKKLAAGFRDVRVVSI